MTCGCTSPGVDVTYIGSVAESALANRNQQAELIIEVRDSGEVWSVDGTPLRINDALTLPEGAELVLWGANLETVHAIEAHTGATNPRAMFVAFVSRRRVAMLPPRPKRTLQINIIIFNANGSSVHLGYRRKDTGAWVPAGGCRD